MPHRVWVLIMTVVVLAGTAAACAAHPDPAPAFPEDAESPAPVWTVAPSRTPTPSRTSTPTPTLPPSRTPAATRTPRPTSTPSSTPTLKPTATPRPTRTRRPTPTPTLVPTSPADAFGVDLLAVRGKEQCVTKLIPARFDWQGVYGGARQMYYWDARWSPNPTFAHPNLKVNTVKAVCEQVACRLRPLMGPRNASGPSRSCVENVMCEAVQADFCVFANPGAPAGIVRMMLDLQIVSGTRSDYGLLTQLHIPFSFLIPGSEG